jgi:hypothetical protein
MKKTFIIISTIISMASCVTKDQIVSNAETELKKDLLDPKTYERIEVTMDTLFKSESLTIDAGGDSMYADMYKGFVESNKEMADLLVRCGSYQAREWYQRSKDHKDSQVMYENRAYEKLKLVKEIKGTSKDSMIQYNVHFRYYAVNRLGTRGIHDGHISMNTDGTFKRKHIND